MRVFRIKHTFSNETSEVTIEKKMYSNGRTSLMLMDFEDGFPYATATVDIPHVDLKEREVIIKDYSENTGMLEFLVKNNIVKETGKVVKSGFITTPIAELLPETDWGIITPEDGESRNN